MADALAPLSWRMARFFEGLRRDDGTRGLPDFEIGYVISVPVEAGPTQLLGACAKMRRATR